MNTFNLKISSPDGDIVNEEAVRLLVRSTEGELTVMAGHVPFVCAVVRCNVTAELSDGRLIRASCDGGLLNVSKEKVILLTGSFE